MTRFAFGLAALALAACQPSVPESGVGFSDYNAYQSARAQRELILTGQAPLAASAQPITSAPVGAPLSATVAPAMTTPSAALPSAGSAALSDEQDFDAVSARETIESDAERLARLRADYQVIDPGALPERAANTGPNIVAFALSTTNNLGEPIYRRSGFNSEARFQRACARYATADEAQRDFLARGGPAEDRLGLDPDGDGFACFWDPRPFRAARGG